MYALAANVYPTNIRATGVGTTVAFGRIGGVLSPIVGAPVLDRGTQPYFFAIAGTMTVVFASLAMVKRHVPRPVFGAKSAVANGPAH
jgi:AAHS family 4-hydroxybenzoate transporter-like MFS transporter